MNTVSLERGQLTVTVLQRGTAWLDTGSFEALNDASNYVRTLVKRAGLKVNCTEELAWRNRWITDDQLEALAQPLIKSGYGEYLFRLLEETN